MITIFSIILSLGLGYVIGNIRTDREYFMNQYRQATSTFYLKSIQFMDAKRDTMQFSDTELLEKLFSDTFNYFYENALFFSEELYGEINQGLQLSRDFVRDYTYSKNDLNPKVFWQWYEKVYFVWLRKELKKVHNKKFWSRLSKVEPCPKLPEYKKSSK